MKTKIILVFDISKFDHFYQFREFFINKFFPKNLRLGFIIHGEYENRKNTYKKLLSLHNPFYMGRFLKPICPIEEIQGSERNYEQVFNDLNYEFKLRAGDLVILIGDGHPFSPNFTTVDYKEILRKFHKRNVRIYSINTGNNPDTKKFMQKISDRYFNLNFSRDISYLLKLLFSTAHIDVSQVGSEQLVENINALYDLQFTPEFKENRYNVLESLIEVETENISKMLNKRVFGPMDEPNLPSKDILIIENGYKDIIKGKEAKDMFTELDRTKYRVFMERKTIKNEYILV